MLRLSIRVRLWLSSAEGQGLVEYALIVAMIAMLLAVSLGYLRTSFLSAFSHIGSLLNQPST
jgi:Flp pilus assembly pilin Flp